MKKKSLRLIGVMLSLTLLLGGCGKSDEPAQDKPVSEPTAVESADKDQQDVAKVTETVTGTPVEVDNGGDAEDKDQVTPIEENIIPDKTPEDILAEMTLTEKIEQMIIATFRYWGEEETDDNKIRELIPEVSDYIRQHHFGGIIFFAQNIDTIGQTVRLIDSVQAVNAESGKTALFTALDQEGGLIVRLGFATRLCGNMALGAAASEELTEKAAELIGNEVHALGFNTNFAPVIDVNDNPSNPIIGVRAFSDDPELVGRMGVSYLKGLTASGVITTVKHFPGHGNTATDSHSGLPLVDKSLDELEKMEFVPYYAVSDSNVDMIMTAHIQFPQIEDEKYTSIEDGEEIYLPATLSKKIITGILREKIGYDGVVVTDSMVMDAIEKNFDPLDSARLAINAGVDILLTPYEPSLPEDLEKLTAYIEGIEAMVKSGEISEDRINESVLRILKLKEKYGLLTPVSPTAEETEEKVRNAEAFVGSKANHELEAEITAETITLIKNDGTLPMAADKKTVIACWYNSQVKAVEYAVERLKMDGFIPADADITCGSFDEKPVSEALELVDGADRVIIVTILSAEKYLNPNDYNGDGEPDEKNWAACVDAIMDHVQKRDGQVVLISSRLPYDIARYSDANAILCCYNNTGMSQDPGDFSSPVPAYGPNIIEAVYAAFGRIHPSGKLPVDVPGIDENYHYTNEIVYERGTGLGY